MGFIFSSIFIAPFCYALVGNNIVSLIQGPETLMDSFEMDD